MADYETGIGEFQIVLMTEVLVCLKSINHCLALNPRVADVEMQSIWDEIRDWLNHCFYL